MSGRVSPPGGCTVCDCGRSINCGPGKGLREVAHSDGRIYCCAPFAAKNNVGRRGLERRVEHREVAATAPAMDCVPAMGLAPPRLTCNHSTGPFGQASDVLNDIELVPQSTSQPAPLALMILRTGGMCQAEGPTAGHLAAKNQHVAATGRFRPDRHQDAGNRARGQKPGTRSSMPARRTDSLACLARIGL